MFSGIWNPNREKSFVDLTENPGVEKHALFRYFKNEDIAVENQKYSANLVVADTVFLQILDYPVKAGIDNIRRPEDVLITEAFAAKIFGSEDPLGKTIFYPVIQKNMTVAGIIRMPTHKSILSFDILVSLQLDYMFRLSVDDPHSLILLHAGVDYRNINRQYPEFMDMTVTRGCGVRHHLFPYGDIYFEKNIKDTSGNSGKHSIFAHGNLIYIFILSSMGILLLLTGLVNYINIRSVVMMRRNRELGMKKVFGAEGFKIFTQLLLENFMLIVLSLIIAFGLAESLSPFMENSLGVLQYPNLRFDLWLSLTLAAALPVAVSIAPSLRYRYFSPIRSLQSINAGNKSLFSRKFYLCFQYFMTIGLIVVSLFFMKQLNFMLDKDLGFRTHDIIKVAFMKSTNVGQFEKFYNKEKAVADELKQKLDASPLLEHWSFGGFPTDNNYELALNAADGKLQTATLMDVDETWLKVFDIKLLDGRLWDAEKDNRMRNIIVNESTLKQFGITNYREGKLRSNWNIIGVVKDFNTAHLSKQINPLVFSFSGRFFGQYDYPVIVSFAPGRKQEVIEFMKNLHNELIGGEFEYTLIEDEIAKLYSEDKKVSVICTAFTGMAILISMLGLLGISLFDIRQRRKEIAIRKIHGAMMKDVLSLLLKKYFVLLGMAFVVSIPAALFVIMKYLENFAYKAPVSWWLFAVALVVTVIVSLLTLIWQAYKAGSEPPAEVVKS
jgi:ABC-type antimicrobial peptide transport system permease subunit